MNALFVAWRPPVDDQTGWRPVGRLEYDGELYRFCYTKGAKLPGFRAFAQMDDLKKIYESEELFPLFANRLLPKSRPEYESYLRWSGFDIEDPPDPILVLGVTEGIRQTDAVEVFPCPSPDADGCYLNKFFLHGIRYMPAAAIDRISSLAPDEPLKILPDLQNEHDSRAVALRTTKERMLIGYVPRYLAHDVLDLIEKCGVETMNVHVSRLNRDAPLQNRVLCRMSACWPDNFRPCSGDHFMRISNAAATKRSA
jgi:hypothetical protein